MAATTNEVIKLDLGYEPAAFEGGPILVQTELSTFVIFKAVFSKRDVKEKTRMAGLALVEFTHCHVSKFGLPNDDAWGGHPLYSVIVDADAWLSIMEVRNSSWKAELERQNKVSYPDWDWPHKHFIISFRESTLECIAKDIQINIFDEPLENLMLRISQSAVADLSR